MSASVNLVPTNRVAQVIGNSRAISAASNNATVVKAGPGSVLSIVASNINAAVRYLKLYDKATTPAPATDNALLHTVIALPANGAPVSHIFPHGLQFATGISYALVTGITDTDNTSVAVSEQLINIQFV